MLKLMYRLAYLIPRLVLLGLALLATSIAGDSIIESLVTAHLESSSGMDVEIGRLRTRTANGKVFVNDLALVDPANPMSNLFQSDLAFLEIDLSAIWKRQLVIEKARASQVRLGVPRTSPGSGAMSSRDSGAFAVSFDQSMKSKSSSIGPFVSNRDAVRTAWIDQFESSGPLVVEEPQKPEATKLYELASATNEKWNKDFKQQNGQLKIVSASFAKVNRGDLSAAEIERNGLNGPPNPLRQLTDSRQQESELEEILKTLERLQHQQVILERQAAIDVARLESTYQNESASRNTTIYSETEVSSENLTQLLLGDLQQQIANEAMGWFAGVRNSAFQFSESDSTTTDRVGASVGQRGRGEFVQIPGAASQRPTVIKKITFDGAGRFNQRHVNFAGEAFDITDQPAIHNQPVTFKLRAQGDQHFVVQGTIDRRSGVESDAVTIDFPAFHLGPQNLGTEDEMLITTGPRTTAHGDISIKIDGQQISGSMRLDFSDVALVVEHLHEVAGGKEVALRLNQSLATLQQFESTATFAGTLAHPRLDFESSLGKEVALAISQIRQRRKSIDQVASNDHVDQFYQTQVAALKTDIKMELDSISRSIDSQIAMAKKMWAALRTAKTHWPEIR